MKQICEEIRVFEGTAERIRTDIENGRIAPLDAGETARALILMSEGFLNQKFGREPRRDWRPAADALATIWLRALYSTEAGLRRVETTGAPGTAFASRTTTSKPTR